MKEKDDVTLIIDDDRLATIIFNKESAPVNVLSKAVLEKLRELLERVREEKVRGLLFRSSKKNCFIAGADVSEFDKIENEDSALLMIKGGRSVINEIEELNIPTVAIIDGVALGGGLELALACDHRIAVENESARLGLPEVKLGIFPGFGGTARLIRLTGVMPAMNMMLTGRTIGVKEAKKLGIVDMVLPARNVDEGARDMIKNKPHRIKAPWINNIFNFRTARNVAAFLLEKNIGRKAKKKHYPAPYALVDLWKKYGDNFNVMLEKEGEYVSRLICTDSSRNLVRLFFLQEKLKGFGKGKKDIGRHVHVVGAGVMGGDIAGWFALKGFSVTLQDTDIGRIAPAIKRAGKLFGKKLKERRLTNAAFDRLIPDPDGDGVRKADLVIEAIFENEKAKKELYAKLWPKMKPAAILATNTSSIPLENLAQSLDDPSRFVGLHFFNPVSQMPLVEVIKSKTTSDETMRTASAFTTAIGKLPLPVKSSTGFLVNRVLLPYLMEGVRLLESGVKAEVIDKSALDFGMPMGPIRLADTVGLDICLNVVREFEKSFDMPVPPILERLVSAGSLGKKSGRGFYVDYDHSFFSYGTLVRLFKGKSAKADPEITKLLIGKIVTECKACLDEKVVDSEDMVDAGMVFGTGFAPFRGGPMRYAQKGDTITSGSKKGKKMKNSKFDFIDPASVGYTIPALFNERVKRGGDKPAYRYFDKSKNAWHTYSWNEAGEMVARFRNGFIRSGLKKGDRVAIMLENSPAWVFIDIAGQSIGLMVVPVYPTDSLENAAYIVGHSKSSLLFVDNKTKAKEIGALLHGTGNAKDIIVAEPEGEGDDGLLYLDSWLPEKGADGESDINPDDVASVVYTSGTTGRPKGVLLSHRNMLSNAWGALNRVPVMADDSLLSFLPLCHTFERTCGYYLPMMAGAQVAYTRSIPQLAEDLLIIKPTVFISVPRIFERVNAKIRVKLAEGSALKAKLFDLAVNIGWERFEAKHGRGEKKFSHLLWPLLDKVVAKKVRDKLGGRLRFSVSGGAPLSPAIAKTFIGLGVELIQGYGMTETSPVICANSIEDNAPFTVGKPLDGITIRISDEGELQVKTDGASRGYLDNESASKALYTEDGWLKTGDLAKVEDGKVSITGRLKEIVVLSTGEKTPPGDMERAIEDDPIVDKAVVVGEGRSFISAILSLDKTELAKMKKEKTFEGSDLEFIDSDFFQEMISERVAKATIGMPAHAKVRKIFATLDEWNIDNGLVTPTLKVKRSKVVEKYSAEVDAMYVKSSAA